MREDDIRMKILDVLGTIAPEADLARLKPDDNICRELDIDSFDFLNLVINISKELGIEVPESDYGKIATLRQMVDYLSEAIIEAN